MEGLTDKVTLRLGDGVQVLKPGEVDTVCLAGMGGVLMSEILEARPEVVEGLKYLILQPMNGAEELRRWLYRHGWHIVDEAARAPAVGRFMAYLMLAESLRLDDTRSVRACKQHRMAFAFR